jgi:predicted secreted protein
MKKDEEYIIEVMDGREHKFPLFLMVLFCGMGVLLCEVSSEAQEKMSAKVNKEFRITLPENPTTGFQWEAKFDDKLLKLRSRDYVATSEAEPGRRGGGGVAVFNFLPLKHGNTSLLFRYKRPWEDNVAEEKSIHLSITD